MKLKIVLIFSLISFSLSVFSQEDSPSFKEKIRPYVEKVIGSSCSEKLLGKKPETIEIPPLPELTKNAQSIAVYEKKFEPQQITKESEKKLNYFFVKELFEAVRKNAPQGDELSTWVNSLDQGASREGVYHALVLDDHYVGLENYNKAPTEELVRVAKDFYSRFIGKNVPAFEKNNFYTIKRELVEKFLDMSSALSSDPEKLHNWYAVLSGEVGEKYGNLFTVDLRKSPSRARHKLWAKSNPMEHLKSEMVIKLHLVMNHLEG